MIHFHIVTLFPESISGYFNASMLKRAQEDKKIKVSFYNPRDFTKDKHKRVDQKPYGGGPGMVLEAESVLRAAQKAIGTKKDVRVIFFSPSGKQFEQKDAQEFASAKHIVFLCGHYEGIDARVVEILNAQPLSVGPYVLTGGELPAAIVADAVSRNIRGVLGNAESLEDSRVASPDVYTRPEVLKWKGRRILCRKCCFRGIIRILRRGRKTNEKPHADSGGFPGATQDR